MALLASLRNLPGKISNEFANPDSLMRSQLRGAAASAAASAAGAAEAASDSAVVARRELGDATVVVGSLVARLATTMSGALRDGEFSAAGDGLLGSVVGAPGGVSATEAAAAAAAAAAEEDEEDEESADGHGGLGCAMRLPRFLRPAHGAVVLFVGGGPVGLWTALQLKLLRPLWRVAVAERHARYVRAHVLRVSAQSFERVVPHPEARAFVARLLGGRPAVAVRTTELERALRALAQGVGVEVLVGEAVRALPLGVAGGGAWLAPPPPPPLAAAAQSAAGATAAAVVGGGSASHAASVDSGRSRAELAGPSADAVLVVASAVGSAAGAAGGTAGPALHSERLQSLLTSASVVVGCDGARSLCRRLLFGSGGSGGLRESQSLAHMVHVRYEARGSTSQLSALAAAGLFSAMGFVGEEHVGRPRGSPAVTPCTLTLVADEAALGPLRGVQGAVALAAAPWAPRLRDAVRLWLNAKAEMVGELRAVGSETVTVVRLSVYRADGFVAYASRVAAELAVAAVATSVGSESTGVPAAASDAAAPRAAPPEAPPTTDAASVPAADCAVPPDAAPVSSPRPPQQALVPPTDVAFALVGDAAFGVPYYRALNNGLVCGSELAAALSEHGSASGNAWRCSGGGGAGSPPLEGYARAAERLATQEIAAARLKAKAFALASAGASAARSLPAGALVHDATRVERWRRTPLESETLESCPGLQGAAAAPSWVVSKA